MPTDLSVVEGDYLQDLLGQPAALRDTWDQLSESKTLKALAARLHKGVFKSVVLTGMGSSFHGLNPLLLQLTNSGFPAVLVETSELIHYRSRLLDKKPLVIAASQSGRSAEVIRLLELNRGRAPVIAVTNTADSPLAKRSEATILTFAGKEFSVSCKTYVTALMALKFLGDQLCRVPFVRTRKELKTVVPATAKYLATWRESLEHLLSRVDGVKQFFLVGRGPSLATTGTGGLILKEATQFPAEGLSSAAFRHGPFEMLGQETFVLVFAGIPKTRELNRRLLEDISRQRGRAEFVSGDAGMSPFHLPAVPDGVLPIVEILPVQMLTLALAARNGREPGKFRFATKITTIE